MVVFLDLDDEAVEPPDQHRDWLHLQRDNAGVLRVLQVNEKGKGDEVERENPNREKACTRALGCYPYVLRGAHFTNGWCKLTFFGRVITSIASHIDLNTLDALSLTCRQVRENLLQYRSKLIASTLHCENEDVELDPEHTFRYRARAADWYFIDSGREALGSGTGKVGDCARDMVGGCRRCGRVVCRVSSTSIL
jgi:hypothetical protein